MKDLSKKTTQTGNIGTDHIFSKKYNEKRFIQEIALHSDKEDVDEVPVKYFEQKYKKQKRNY